MVVNINVLVLDNIDIIRNDLIFSLKLKYLYYPNLIKSFISSTIRSQLIKIVLS